MFRYYNPNPVSANFSIVYLWLVRNSFILFDVFFFKISLILCPSFAVL